MKRRDEVLVGIFTTLAVVIAVLGSIWLVRGGLQSGYPLYSRFQWGSQLKQGQPVWLVGVTVGFVDKVDLDPRGTLVVRYRIRKEYRVPRTSTASKRSDGTLEQRWAVVAGKSLLAASQHCQATNCN